VLVEGVDPGRPAGEGGRGKTQKPFNNLHPERMFFKRKKPSRRVFFRFFSVRCFFLHFFADSRVFMFA
jgi:hypothetical protein